MSPTEEQELYWVKKKYSTDFVEYRFGQYEFGIFKPLTPKFEAYNHAVANFLFSEFTKKEKNIDGYKSYNDFIHFLKKTKQGFYSNYRDWLDAKFIENMVNHLESHPEDIKYHDFIDVVLDKTPIILSKTQCSENILKRLYSIKSQYSQSQSFEYNTFLSLINKSSSPIFISDDFFQDYLKNNTSDMDEDSLQQLRRLVEIIDDNELKFFIVKPKPIKLSLAEKICIYPNLVNKIAEKREAFECLRKLADFAGINVFDIIYSYFYNNGDDFPVNVIPYALENKGLTSMDNSEILLPLFDAKFASNPTPEQISKQISKIKQAITEKGIDIIQLFHAVSLGLSNIYESNPFFYQVFGDFIIPEMVLTCIQEGTFSLIDPELFSHPEFKIHLLVEILKHCEKNIENIESLENIFNLAYQKDLQRIGYFPESNIPFFHQVADHLIGEIGSGQKLIEVLYLTGTTSIRTVVESAFKKKINPDIYQENMDIQI